MLATNASCIIPVSCQTTVAVKLQSNMHANSDESQQWLMCSIYHEKVQLIQTGLDVSDIIFNK